MLRFCIAAQCLLISAACLCAQDVSAKPGKIPQEYQKGFFHTALIEAMSKSDWKEVNRLLMDGFAINVNLDINHLYDHGFSIHYAFEHPATLKSLIQYGLDVNLDSENDGTSLEIAVERIHFFNSYEKDDEDYEESLLKLKQWKAAERILLEAGAKETITTAIYRDDIIFLKQLYEESQCWINEWTSDGPPLDLAVTLGRLEICKWLLDKGADPNGFKNGLGLPIILGALNNPSVVELLIKNGANIRRRVSQGWGGGSGNSWFYYDTEKTVLHFAIYAGNPKVVQMLVDAGADPNSQDTLRATPLVGAIAQEKGEDEQKQDTSNYLKIIEILLKNDASVKLKDKDGLRPLQYAEKIGSREEVIELLKKYDR